MNFNEVFSKTPIQFNEFIGQGTSSFPNELTDFCFGDINQPLGDTLKRGAQAMRTGYYKIISAPQERKFEHNNITTWASYVLFCREDYQNPILYFANVGTLFNFDAKYGENQESVWQKFVKNGTFSDKEDFFKNGLEGRTIEVLKDEWIKSEKFGTDVKKVTWKFV